MQAGQIANAAVTTSQQYRVRKRDFDGDQDIVAVNYQYLLALIVVGMPSAVFATIGHGMAFNALPRRLRSNRYRVPFAAA